MQSQHAISTRREARHYDFARHAEIEEREAAIQVLDVVHIVPDEVMLRVLQKFQHRMRFAQDARFANPARAVCQFDEQIRQIAPGRPPARTFRSV